MSGTEKDDERRDAALRRMLATPKAKKDRGAEGPLSPSQEQLGRRRDRKNDVGGVKSNCHNDPKG
jgi:hypothetical protein